MTIEQIIGYAAWKAGNNKFDVAQHVNIFNQAIAKINATWKINIANIAFEADLATTQFKVVGDYTQTEEYKTNKAKADKETDAPTKAKLLASLNSIIKDFDNMNNNFIYNIVIPYLVYTRYAQSEEEEYARMAYQEYLQNTRAQYNNFIAYLNPKYKLTNQGSNIRIGTTKPENKKGGIF